MPFLAQPLYWGAWVFLTWTIGAVRFFAGIPGGDLAIAMDANLTGAFYLAVTTGAIARGTNPDWRSAVGSVLRKRRFGLALLGAGGIMTALLWPAVFALPDGRMHVHFLDSGHSNAVLIETPRGAQILVDGGKYPTRLLTALGDHMPFWDRNIELLILTQPKASQFAAIPSVLERYTIGQVLTNGQPSDSDTYTALTGALSQQAIPVLPVSRGYVVETNEGVRLEVLYPLSTPGEEDEPTDAGLVLRLSYGEASFLLAPDLSSAAETTLIESGQWLHGSVLQLPAHGSDNVSSQSFLDAVAPQLAVVQVDTGNRFGHPAEAVLARLGNTPLYRTDQSGEITFSTDGTTLWVNSEDQQ
jgi:competence protein ComEC